MSIVHVMLSFCLGNARMQVLPMLMPQPVPTSKQSVSSTVRADWKH